MADNGSDFQRRRLGVTMHNRLVHPGGDGSIITMPSVGHLVLRVVESRDPQLGLLVAALMGAMLGTVLELRSRHSRYVVEQRRD